MTTDYAMTWVAYMTSWATYAHESPIAWVTNLLNPLMKIAGM